VHVSSSVAGHHFAERTRLWGPHPLLDPYYSSGHVQIVHDGIVNSRFEKTVFVTDWPVAVDTCAFVRTMIVQHRIAGRAKSVYGHRQLSLPSASFTLPCSLSWTGLRRSPPTSPIRENSWSVTMAPTVTLQGEREKRRESKNSRPRSRRFPLRPYRGS